MNKKLRILLASVVSLSFVATAYAAEKFYLEIGKPVSVEEVHEQWRDLSGKYKSSLGKLKLYPKSVMNGGSDSSIIQAGPISDKNRAQKICNQLFADDVQCFVIEGIEKSPPTMSVGISRAASMQPDQIFTSSGDFSSHSNSNGQGQVDVAEAISVPLTEATNEIKAAPPIADDSYVEDKIGANSVHFSSESSGNLIVETFSSEAAANRFWNYVADKFPDLASGRKVHVKRPFSSNRRGVQVSVGLFDNGQEASTFCNKAVVSYHEGLRCNYDDTGEQPVVESKAKVEEKEEKTEDEKVEDKFLSRPNQRVKAYQERRQRFERRVPAQQNSFFNNRKRHTQSYFAKADEESDNAKVADSQTVGSQYWLQVAVADSKSEASRRLGDIKRANSDVIVDMNSRVTSSVSAHAKYKAMLGSMSTERDANNLCDVLLSRGVDCLVVKY